MSYSTDTMPAIGALALARVPFLSASGRLRLALSLGDRPLETLGCAEAETVLGRKLDRERWMPGVWQKAAIDDAEYLQRAGAYAVTYFDHRYPALLRETHRPPFLLYVRGTLPPADRPALAIVGTRYPTGRGLEAARTLAAEAGMAGIPVVSGLARGIDSAAHRGAIAGGGATWAVLGRGIDEVYPPSNRDLASAMLERGGGLVSEYPPGTSPSRWTFPERNRILVGLCRSTVVVEAPGHSGALISAGFANDEGRDVYVAGACRGGYRSAGSDALAEDGATVIHGLGDILDDWKVYQSAEAF